MKNNLKYKETNISWIGQIPIDWSLRKGKYLFSRPKEINKDLKCKNLLSLTYDGVLNKDFYANEGLRPENYNTYQLFDKDDLVFKMIDLNNVKTSRVGIVHEYGIMSSAYICFRSLKDKIYPKFAYWFFYDLYKKEVYNSIGNGVRSTLSSDDMSEFEIPLPQIEEQKLISCYLDNKTKQLDKLLDKIQKKIELLKEQRLSFIKHCITKGIDTNFEMKESGVDWIGEIPKHWTVKKVKYLGKIKSGEGITAQDFLEGGDYKVFGGNGIVGLFNKFNIDKTVIVIGRVGEKCGNIHLVKEKSWISDNSLILELFNPEYYDWASLALESRDLNLIRNQSSQPLITGSQIKNESIPIPPENEYTKISVFIQSNNFNFFERIKKETQKIELLKEYRKSLISSVVSGKIRVTKDMI